MLPFHARLAECLAAHGWEVERIDQNQLEWWADDIWRLASRWSPVAAEAFISFLVDPLWEGNRRSGQGVWAVGLCGRFPRDQSEARQDGLLGLKATQEQIEGFVDAMQRRRHALRARRRS